LRLGNSEWARCVYTYDIEETPQAMVYIRAVGVKIRGRVYVGGEEIEL